MSYIRILSTVFGIVLITSILNCQQLDGGSTVTGREANQLILSGALLGATGAGGSVLPIGASITCNNGVRRTVTSSGASGIYLFSSILLIPALGLEETLFYSKADVNKCVDAVTILFYNASRESISVSQRNTTCSESNDGPLDPVIGSILACEIETKARLTFSNNDDSSEEE